ILATAVGITVAYVMSVRYHVESALDVAVMGLIIGIGLAFNIWRWVRLVRRGHRARTPWTREMEGASDDLGGAVRVVLGTPTLVYVFLAGAMIAFGMNGLVGWGPTFMTRMFGLTAGQSAALLGKW